MRSSAGGGASFSSSSCLGCAITGFGRGSGGEGAETLLTGGLGAAVGGGMGACGGRRTPAWIPDGRPAADAEVGLGATMLMPFISPLATLPNPVAPPGGFMPTPPGEVSSFGQPWARCGRRAAEGD